jgi:uncharacterized short protein YbdD (DUF466 family)
VDGKPGVVGIPFFDNYVEKAALEFLDTAAKSDKPFFINVNFMKVHQPKRSGAKSTLLIARHLETQFVYCAAAAWALAVV